MDGICRFCQQKEIDCMCEDVGMPTGCNIAGKPAAAGYLGISRQHFHRYSTAPHSFWHMLQIPGARPEFYTHTMSLDAGWEKSQPIREAAAESRKKYLKQFRTDPSSGGA